MKYIGASNTTHHTFNKAAIKHHFIKSMILSGFVLCSVSVVTQAADFSTQPKPAFTLKVVTHGEGGNRSDNFSKKSMQDNRRADVSIKTQVHAGTRIVTETVTDEVSVKVKGAVNRSIRLNDGGVIWVSNDPSTLVPTLNVTANQNVKMKGDIFDSPLSFTINTNYATFIDSWELLVYDENDHDERDPLVTFAGRKPANGQSIKWNGTNTKAPLKAGDKLKYVFVVKDSKGHIDKTHARYIHLLDAGRHVSSSINSASTGENNLKIQTIPLHGSRIRIFGRDIVDGNQIQIDDEPISLKESKFVIERIMPEGRHSFDVSITDNDKQTHNKSLDVKVDSKYMFMVGLADVTVGEGKVAGNLETLSDGDKYLEGDVFVDGRLAFYLKGKIKGKYLVTAQMDTGTAEIDELFDDIHKKDPRSLFRRLDPDKYYPVYGDDSTVIDDTDSQGKMYVRVDWDKSRAIWGNYNTDMTGTELGAFNRSLYGAKLSHKNTKVTKDGEHKTDVTVFASEAQSAFGHNQFLGTGGSLYYLKDTDIVNGSEKIWIEIRERNSERATSKVTLEAGRDYEIDDFQGRIILHRPLLQIAEQENATLIKDTPLDGNQVYLMVDYEYVPSDFDSDKASFGGRGKVWLNDHVAVGGSIAHENRATDDYDLKAVDITLQKKKGTYLVAEYAESESQQTKGNFYSDDGGLNFNNLITPTTTADIKGSAYSIEARTNLEDVINKPGSLGAWYKQREAGFSSSRLSQGVETTDAGVEATVDASDKLKLSARATLLDKKAQSKLTTASVQGDYKLNNKVTLGAEIRHVQEEDQSGNTTLDGEGTLGAFKVGYDVNKDLNIYAIGQGTISKEGNYSSNDLFTVGAKAKIGSRYNLNAEVSSGDRGDSATLGLDYKLNDSHSLYTNYSLSTDRTDNKRNIFTVGQRKSVTNRLKVFTEHQFTHEDTQSGLGHTFGLDYDYNEDLTFSGSVQSARLDKANGSGITDRDAFSVGLSYSKDKTKGSSRLEYRRDKGAQEDVKQWVSTNQLHYRVNPSLRLQGRLNYSETKDQNGQANDARFTEAGLGFAYRPTNNDRLNMLGRLTYVDDLQPTSQSTTADERSLISSLEVSYQIDQKWEVGGKLAHKKSEVRNSRASGNWEENDATLAAARVRYHMTHNWDAMAQYHWMNSDASQDTQHGALLSVERHIGKNMKVGIGYNFTEFDDDLSNTNGTAKGWFVNLVGKF